MATLSTYTNDQQQLPNSDLKNWIYNGASILSTENWKLPKLQVLQGSVKGNKKSPGPLVIRSEPQADVNIIGSDLSDRFYAAASSLLSLQQPDWLNVYQYFDHHDIHHQGEAVLRTVLVDLSQPERQQAREIDGYNHGQQSPALMQLQKDMTITEMQEQMNGRPPPVQHMAYPLNTAHRYSGQGNNLNNENFAASPLLTREMSVGNATLSSFALKVDRIRGKRRWRSDYDEGCDRVQYRRPRGMSAIPSYYQHRSSTDLSTKTESAKTPVTPISLSNPDSITRSLPPRALADPRIVSANMYGASQGMQQPFSRMDSGTIYMDSVSPEVQSPCFGRQSQYVAVSSLPTQSTDVSPSSTIATEPFPDFYIPLREPRGQKNPRKSFTDDARLLAQQTPDPMVMPHESFKPQPSPFNQSSRTRHSFKGGSRRPYLRHEAQRVDIFDNTVNRPESQYVHYAQPGNIIQGNALAMPGEPQYSSSGFIAAPPLITKRADSARIPGRFMNYGSVSQEIDPKKLYFCGKGITADEIVHLCQDLGMVTDVCLNPVQGRPELIRAFVLFSDENAAAQARTKLKNLEFGGKLFVDYAFLRRRSHQLSMTKQSGKNLTEFLPQAPSKSGDLESPIDLELMNPSKAPMSPPRTPQRRRKSKRSVSKASTPSKHLVSGVRSPEAPKHDFQPRCAEDDMVAKRTDGGAVVTVDETIDTDLTTTAEPDVTPSPVFDNDNISKIRPNMYAISDGSPQRRPKEKQDRHTENDCAPGWLRNRPYSETAASGFGQNSTAEPLQQPNGTSIFSASIQKYDEAAQTGLVVTTASSASQRTDHIARSTDNAKGSNFEQRKASIKPATPLLSPRQTNPPASQVADITSGVFREAELTSPMVASAGSFINTINTSHEKEFPTLSEAHRSQRSRQDMMHESPPRVTAYGSKNTRAKSGMEKTLARTTQSVPLSDNIVISSSDESIPDRDREKANSSNKSVVASALQIATSASFATVDTIDPVNTSNQAEILKPAVKITALDRSRLNEKDDSTRSLIVKPTSTMANPPDASAASVSLDSQPTTVFRKTTVEVASPRLSDPVEEEAITSPKIVRSPPAHQVHHQLGPAGSVPSMRTISSPCAETTSSTVERISLSINMSPMLLSSELLDGSMKGKKDTTFETEPTSQGSTLSLMSTPPYFSTHKKAIQRRTTELDVDSPRRNTMNTISDHVDEGNVTGATTIMMRSTADRFKDSHRVTSHSFIKTLPEMDEVNTLYGGKPLKQTSVEEMKSGESSMAFHDSMNGNPKRDIKVDRAGTPESDGLTTSQTSTPHNPNKDSKKNKKKKKRKGKKRNDSSTSLDTESSKKDNPAVSAGTQFKANSPEEDKDHTEKGFSRRNSQQAAAILQQSFDQSGQVKPGKTELQKMKDAYDIVQQFDELQEQNRRKAQMHALVKIAESGRAGIFELVFRGKVSSPTCRFQSPIGSADSHTSNESDNQRVGHAARKRARYTSGHATEVRSPFKSGRTRNGQRKRKTRASSQWPPTPGPTDAMANIECVPTKPMSPGRNRLGARLRQTRTPPSPRRTSEAQASGTGFSSNFSPALPNMPHIPRASAPRHLASGLATTRRNSPRSATDRARKHAAAEQLLNAMDHFDKICKSVNPRDPVPLDSFDDGAEVNNNMEASSYGLGIDVLGPLTNQPLTTLATQSISSGLNYQENVRIHDEERTSPPGSPPNPLSEANLDILEDEENENVIAGAGFPRLVRRDTLNSRTSIATNVSGTSTVKERPLFSEIVNTNPSGRGGSSTVVHRPKDEQDPGADEDGGGKEGDAGADGEAGGEGEGAGLVENPGGARNLDGHSRREFRRENVAAAKRAGGVR